MALVLTRRAGESIRIGDDILVTIGEIHGGQVRVLITAPQHIKILRTELDTRTWHVDEEAS